MWEDEMWGRRGHGGGHVLSADVKRRGDTTG